MLSDSTRRRYDIGIGVFAGAWAFSITAGVIYGILRFIVYLTTL